MVSFYKGPDSLRESYSIAPEVLDRLTRDNGDRLLRELSDILPDAAPFLNNAPDVIVVTPKSPIVAPRLYDVPGTGQEILK